MGVTLAGVVWVWWSAATTDDHPHARHRAVAGVLLAAAASAVMAVGYVLSKEGLGDYDAVAATLIRVLVALPFYALLITLWHRWPAMLATLQHRRVMAIVTFGAIVGPFIGVVFSMIALRHAPAGVVTTIIATSPVLILPFSVFLHHERASLRAVGGAVVAMGGIALLMLL